VRELNAVGNQECVPGLTFSECHVLSELEQRASATNTDLAEALVLEKSTISRLTQGLSRRGLIAASPNPADRRQRPFALTSQGQETVLAVNDMARSQVSAALDFVPPAERDELANSLDRYARALRYARFSSRYRIRPMAPEDDPAMARIIVDVMTEFGAVGCGYSIEDPEVNHMYSAYDRDDAEFYVVESADGEVLGGGGVAPLKGADADICELQKMYFRPQLRGTGMGTRLLIHCLDRARALGYRLCYLETLESMHQARHVYRKLGFEDLEAPMGGTGHFKCNRWMSRVL
jgi:putative acetyltransferase